MVDPAFLYQEGTTLNTGMIPGLLMAILMTVLFSVPCPAVEPALSVSRARVMLKKENHLSYRGRFAHEFPEGIPFSPGSGLCYRGKDTDGSWLFWGLTDRGPGLAAPYSPAGIRQRVYLLPSFSPSILGLRYRPGSAEMTIDSSISLCWKDGMASGLPFPLPGKREKEEISLDEDFQVLTPDPRGIDSEGIALAADGAFWICDEYRPALLKADRAGKIVKCLEPSRGLPAWLALRGRNRGFEGVAVLPGGQVLTALQSPLATEKGTEDFVRFILYDETCDTAKVLAYPLEPGLYRDLKSVRISDLAVLDENHLLVLEQGPWAGGPRKRHIGLYVASLEGRTPGQGRETGAESLQAEGIQQMTRRKICELGSLGWLHDGFAEGMALVDGNTVVIIDDSDFGAESCIYTTDGKRLKGDNRAYTLGNGILRRDGKPTKDRYAIVPGTPYPRVMILHFQGKWW